MLPKSGTRLPKSKKPLSDAELAFLIGTALRGELGASHRAAKTIMTWTGVSDHTARSWLNGRSSPSSLHMLALASQSRPVMTTMLKVAGHDDVAIGIDLETLEQALSDTLLKVQSLRSSGQ